jgi:predicted RNase H-like HicB family nuclease
LKLTVETEEEEDGRWIAEIPDLPGVMAYGSNPAEARARVQALALRVVADRLEHGETGPDLLNISFIAA